MNWVFSVFNSDSIEPQIQCGRLFGKKQTCIPPPLKMELTVFRNVGTLNSHAGNHSKERMQHLENGESLKSRRTKLIYCCDISQ